jgi:mono/diheme cytochrome c family protein
MPLLHEPMPTRHWAEAWAGWYRRDVLKTTTTDTVTMHARVATLSATALAVVLALGAVRLLRSPIQAAAPANDAARVALGRHLVQDVALCADCHSPRLPTGAFDEAHWLQGAPIDFKPTFEMPWALAAPAIAGLSGFSDDHVITLLTTGARPGGQPALPPMPSFKLTDEEARAVVAYLRSLPAAQ